METPKRRRVYAPINYDKSVTDYVDHQVMCVLDMHILRVEKGTALMTAWKIRENEEKAAAEAAAAEAAAEEAAKPPPPRRNPRRGVRDVN
jgi:hypothetical protein